MELLILCGGLYSLYLSAYGIASELDFKHSQKERFSK